MSDIFVSPILQQEIYDLVAKRTSLLQHIHTLETLVLGSSHGDFGFNPEYVPESFNLCSPSQDLRHSMLLYEKCNSMNPNIKNIVVFYSVFSSGHLLEKTSEKEKCAAFKELFALDAEYDSDEINEAYRNIQGKLNGMRSEVGHRGFIRNNEGPYYCDGMEVAQRIGTHLKHYNRKNEDLRLVQMVMAAQARGQNIVVVVPPSRNDYKAEMAKIEPRVFKGLYEIAGFQFQRPLPIINFYDDFSFLDKHFGDFDHLLPYGDGTVQVSTRINNYLK
jgi:hypothetical protein